MALRLLSFDTSTANLYLCLSEDGQVVDERVLAPSSANRQEAATSLLPAVDAIIKEAGWRKEDLKALVVGQGPGSFTGVRAAVVVARTLAQALMLPLIGVCRLECIASLLGQPGGVILSGAPDHFFVAAYEPTAEGTLKPLIEPSYSNWLTLKQHIGLTALWSADESAQAALNAHGLSCQSLPVIKNIAATQAQIAWDRLSLSTPGSASESGQPVLAQEFPWSRVEPLYLRGASVTIKKSHGDSNKKNDSL